MRLLGRLLLVPTLLAFESSEGLKPGIKVAYQWSRASTLFPLERELNKHAYSVMRACVRVM